MERVGSGAWWGGGRAILLVGAIVARPDLAHAHTTAPAALDVVSVRDGEPEVVRMNFGLAIRKASDPQHFRYICPGQWGEVDAVPSMAAFTDGRLLVPLFGTVYTADAGGCAFTRLPVAGWAGQTPVSLAGQGPIHVLTRDDAGSTLWVFDATEDGVVPLDRQSFPDVKLDAVIEAPGGVQYLASARPTPVLYRRAPDGTTPQGLAGLDAGERPQYLDPRAVDPGDGGHLFLAVNVRSGVRLYETRDAGATVAQVLSAGESILGPVSIDGGLLAVADGVLQVRGPDERAFRPVAADGATTTQPFTCLQTVGGQVLACRNREIVHLSGPAEAPVASPAFSFVDLQGPEPGCPQNPGLVATCQDQWLHFSSEVALFAFDGGVPPSTGDAAVDAGRSDAAAVVEVAGHPRGGGGCSTAPPGEQGTAWGLAGLTMLPLVRRRARRTFKSPPDPVSSARFSAAGGATRDDEGHGQR